jgi:hypothetical protein
MCLLLAGVFAWFFRGLLRWQPLDVGQELLFSALAFSVFVATPVFVLRRSKIGECLAGFTGALFVLYAIAALLVGWEYLGGALGTIATALVTGGSGALGIYLASKIDRPPAA